MIQRLRTFWHDRSAATAVEFTLVLPLLLILFFGIIDAGVAMWTWNRAEKATQMGVRYAVATDMLPIGLRSYSFTVDGGMNQGEVIPASRFGGATCTSTTCTCNTGATCPALGNLDTVAFTRLVTRMQAIMPQIQAANVQVDYGYSGLGYAGDPNGPDVAPMVTVKLVGMQFRPITFLAFGGPLTLPDFAATLSTEDGAGRWSN